MMTPTNKFIFFDATYLHYAGDLRGIVQVILQLTRMLSSDNRFKKIRFIATKGESERLLLESGISSERLDFVPLMPFISKFERFHGLFVAWRYRPILAKAAGIIHPEFRTFVAKDIHQVVLLYDFIFMEPPHLSGPKKWDRFLYFYGKYKIASRADQFISVTDQTRYKALQFFPRIKPQSITTLHLGVRAGLLPARPISALPDFSTLHFLYVGSVEPRKNVAALLSHFTEVSQGAPAILHVVGNLFPAQEAAMKDILRNTRLEKSVILHGKVTDTTLHNLYQQTHFLLFPSLMEGFGLPIIEAMNQGVLTCAFDNSCIREVGGEDLILSGNNDFKAWGEAISELIKHPQLFIEKKARWKQRANYFSESSMFERYSNYFERVLAGIAASP